MTTIQSKDNNRVKELREQEIRAKLRRDCSGSRRTFLTLASTICVAGFSGCISELSVGEPDPRVEEGSVEGDFFGAITGQAEVHLVIRNEGDAGDVRITVVALDENNAQIDRYTTSKVVHFEEGERKRIIIEVEFDGSVEEFQHNVEPA